MKKNQAIRNAKNFDELLNIQYGEIGEKKRDAFEEATQYFVISENVEGRKKSSTNDARGISK